MKLPAFPTIEVEATDHISLRSAMKQRALSDPDVMMKLMDYARAGNDDADDLLAADKWKRMY
jgi:hypothetical protein